MKARKGFTLVELMVVVLIVGILAAVAIPLMKGRIDSAKWSEGKAGAGTIASAIRAYCAEKGTLASSTDLGTGTAALTKLGFSDTDLVGTYFTQGSYAVTAVSYTDTAPGGANATITVTAPTGILPATKILKIENNVAAWTEN